MDIGSNGVTLENLRFDLTAFDALVAPFDVNSTGFTLRNCDIETADSGGQCTNAFLTGTTPVSLNEGANSNGGSPSGSVLTGRNYFRGASTVAAGTLL